MGMKEGDVSVEWLTQAEGHGRGLCVLVADDAGEGQSCIGTLSCRQQGDIDGV